MFPTGVPMFPTGASRCSRPGRRIVSTEARISLETGSSVRRLARERPGAGSVAANDSGRRRRARAPPRRPRAGRGAPGGRGPRRRPVPGRGRRPPARGRRQAAPAHTHPLRGLRGRRRRHGAADAAITGGAAVELVHLGSLYHDDVIDEAETRRGVPSVNARWSNIVAILAGDYLLAQASSLAASLGADVAGLLADDDRRAVPRSGARAAVPLRRRPRSEESYLSAIEGKTASLMATACRIGGMVSDVSADTLDALTQFGHAPRHVLPDRRRRARRHRAPKPSSASPPATTCTRACTRCP